MVTFVTDAKILACAVDAFAVNAAVADAFISVVLTSESVVTTDTGSAVV